MKKTFCILTIITFILSCKQKISEPELKINEAKESVFEQNPIICKKLSANGIELKTCLKEYDFFTLKTIDGKTLYKNDNNPSEFILTDFNEDGFLDIKLHFMTNVPDVNEILLFNPKLKIFTEIENFSNFPASLKINNTNYYYSYERSGCADSNWDSYLYYIKGNKAIKIGNIHTRECDNESDNGTYIYKINGENKEQIKHIPIPKKGFENKWEFIKNYWTENYKKFE